jgi:CubicO group peptidase (beta-lactamase class C family)
MRQCVRLCVLLVALLATLQAQVLPPGTPADVGLSKERLERIKATMDTEIAQSRLAGGVGLVARKGKVAYVETFGMADKEGGRPMQKDTMFDLTKGTLFKQLAYQAIVSR